MGFGLESVVDEDPGERNIEDGNPGRRSVGFRKIIID